LACEQLQEVRQIEMTLSQVLGLISQLGDEFTLPFNAGALAGQLHTLVQEARAEAERCAFAAVDPAAADEVKRSNWKAARDARATEKRLTEVCATARGIADELNGR
jgi:hypothetical protein